ncbi:MAG: hypothetical protein LC655_06875, partial [Bacteroidales bacterium]|nr:hypothetical protein [Bacteroidales bacterium]
NDPDPLLHNGTVYNFISVKTDGHQFLEGDTFFQGAVTIGNKTYEGLYLNYDIFNQEVLLRIELDRTSKIISLPKERISGFTIGNRSFVVLHDRQWEYSIYEITGSRQLAMLYRWTKDIKVSTNNDVYNYLYTNAKRTMFLLRPDGLTKIRGKRDFLNAFEDDEKAALKRYMRTNKIRFRTMQKSEMQELINYVSRL